MKPTAGSSANNFDLLRICAALQVVLMHGFWHLQVPSPSWRPLLESLPGVPVFFAISGFLISRSYERSTDLASYARNRALRIYPALWVCILLTVVVASAAGFSFAHRQAATWLPAQLVGLIYTPRFLDGFGFGSYNGSLWTIPIELQFYVAVPVIYALLRRAGWRIEAGLAALLLAFAAVALVFASTVPPALEGQPEPVLVKLLRYSFAPHIYMFLAGALLQRLKVERSPWIAGKGLHWLAAYLALYFLLPRNPWTAIGGALLLAVCVVALAYSATGLSQRLLRGNDVSYGVYIYHGLLMNIMLVLGWQGRVGSMVGLVVGALLMGLASWRFVEQPCLRRKRKSPARLAAAPT